jgi:hypothetical protein
MLCIFESDFKKSKVMTKVLKSAEGDKKCYSQRISKEVVS